MMKRTVIIFLIYEDNIYVKRENKIITIPLDKDVVVNGRINSVKKLIDNLKKIKPIFKSFFKIVYDSYIMIFFSNYNNFEKRNIINDFKEYGIEKIHLVDFQKIINAKSDETHVIYNHNNYYVIEHNSKTIFPSICNNFGLTNGKIISDDTSYVTLKKHCKDMEIYVVDDLPKYLLNATF